MALKENINYGECRCCLEKGHHKDLTKEYVLDGNSEMYADIFIECFNLFLCSDTRLTSLICQSCIKQLKDAHNFKKTVISLENEMLKALCSQGGREVVFVNDVIIDNIKEELKDAVKEELSLEPDDEQPEFEDLLDEEDIDAEPVDVLVCGEKELLARFSRETVPPLPTRASLAARCPGYARRLEELKGQVVKARAVQELLKEPRTTLTHKKTRHKSVNNIRIKHLEIGRNNSTLENTSSAHEVPLTEKMAQVTNICTLLENSNLTAFMSKFKNGFPCFYCKRIFEKFDALREHQIEHSKDNLQKIILNRYRKGRPDSLVVYVDLTGLKCTLCGDQMASLNDLKSHLSKQHKKTLYSSYTDRVIPFLISDTYLCQVCSFDFETFGAIERHMNTHFRNYVCEDCGAGFIAKHRLKVHSYNVHCRVQGKFTCDICKKTFPTRRKFKIHNNFVHKKSKILQCPKCPARFSYYYVRQKHLLNVHGETPVIYKCNVCGKEFKRRYPLSIHIKKEHLNQGDFNCELCSYTCYSSNELKVHLVKKHGEMSEERPLAAAKSSVTEQRENGGLEINLS